jgi:hypothetical protein
VALLFQINKYPTSVITSAFTGLGATIWVATSTLVRNKSVVTVNAKRVAFGFSRDWVVHGTANPRATGRRAVSRAKRLAIRLVVDNGTSDVSPVVLLIKGERKRRTIRARVRMAPSFSMSVLTRLDIEKFAKHFVHKVFNISLWLSWFREGGRIEAIAAMPTLLGTVKIPSFLDVVWIESFSKWSHFVAEGPTVIGFSMFLVAMVPIHTANIATVTMLAINDWDRRERHDET